MGIQKILIANRGEIAVRIIRTCRELGIRSVAVFSEADRRAPHTRLADEALPIGPAPLGDSYLRFENILDAARTSGADAIHPGYGFLSENASFADACTRAGITFIGPPAGSIRRMGDKTAARNLMAKAGVPIVPGTKGALPSSDEATRVAEQIGYPVLLKAAAGGGGKGMRIVKQRSEMDRSFEQARGEAQTAFGDDRLFLEKYISEPRHIEVQVLADRHGHCVYLFERECSIQRRHQKIIEEAPSSLLTPEVRARMGEVAVQAARACGYVNAGTIEFLVDADLNFYFMEMNTRLQVEHPVTEWITGVDLVAEQIRVAEGHPLRFTQEDLSIHGHALECRIYAEDPTNHFLPDPGRLLRYEAPGGPGVRVDAGVEQGSEIHLFYDPMIAKLSVWAGTRDEAIARMERALSEYRIAGVHTTIPFCRFVVGHEQFKSGQYSTHFIDEHFRPENLRNEEAESFAALAAALYYDRNATAPVAAPPAASESRWVLRRLNR